MIKIEENIYLFLYRGAVCIGHFVRPCTAKTDFWASVSKNKEKKIKLGHLNKKIKKKNRASCYRDIEMESSCFSLLRCLLVWHRK